MLKEADRAREIATELEALAPSLTTENSFANKGEPQAIQRVS
jgi:hypothetical protein